MPFTISFTVPSPPAATILWYPSSAAFRARASACPASEVAQRIDPRASFSTCARRRGVLAPRAAGLRMTTVSFKIVELAFVFSSNRGGVTFRRAKNEPHDLDRAGGDRRRRLAHFVGREHVCAVARDTSPDSAGT